MAPGRAGRDLLLDSIGPGSLGSPPPNIPPELTCISEEGGLDLDLDLDIPEHLLEDLDCGGDCITSCNKVMLYLVNTRIRINKKRKSYDIAVSTSKMYLGTVNVASRLLSEGLWLNFGSVFTISKIKDF